MRRVVIVGGGIAGLSALESLSRADPELHVILLEARERLGGHIRTDRDGEFVMEAGPDVVLAAKPAAVELARRVGLGERLQGTNPAAKGSHILAGRKLRRLPEGLTGLVPSRIGPFVTTTLLSPLAKLRVALDYFVPPRTDDLDESIESFVVRRLGRAMYEQLVEPLLSGISAGDGSRLSMQAMFPQLREMERRHGGLLRGMLAAKRAPTPQRQAGAMGFLSLPGGLGELVDGVERAVCTRDKLGRIDIRTNAAVSRIERTADGFAVHVGEDACLSADAVIVATPAYVAADQLRFVHAGLSKMLREIEYVSTVTISVAYPVSAVARPLDATGYVVPRVLERPVLACTWASTKFEGRAPGGYALFRLFLGGAGRGEFANADDATLREIVRREMREIMGVTAEPVLVRINRFDRALPQYNVGHLARLARVESAVAGLPGLALAGAAYRGVGIPDCVRSGERAAIDILRELHVPASSAPGNAP